MIFTSACAAIASSRRITNAPLAAESGFGSDLQIDATRSLKIRNSAEMHQT
jgi:hypothetical protein